MTASYEAARAAASNLIGGQPNELVFTRGATEAINLVARALPKEGRNRVLLSQLEHHSNIVPWQLAGYEVDAVPLTRRRPDRPRRRRSDADRRASRRRLRACVERARLDPRREARGRDRAFEGRAAAARRLPGGAAHAGRRRRDRRRFLRFLRAQALRPDRHRLPVGPRRAARRNAAVAGRRRDDREGHVRGDDLSSTRRCGSRRGRRTSSARSGCTRRSTGSRSCRSTRSTPTNARWSPRCRAALSRHRRRHPLRPRGQRRDRQLQRRRGASRTTPPPYWTMRASRSAPATIARSR